MASGSKCKNCGSADIEVDPGRGDAVCTNCGSVLEDSIIVSEVQFVEGAHGSSNALGQFVAVDSQGGATKYGASFHVGGGLESREITLKKAKSGITLLGQQLRLSQHCIDTACNFYRIAITRNLTRGRKNTHIYAACVYLSCRTEATAHLLIDISDVLQICCYELGRTYLKLSQALCINVPSIDPCLYILRFASKLEFGSKLHQVSNTALRLVQRMKRDSMHSGRKPSGLCGAALLIAARLHEFNRTVGDILKVVKVHESTMRKRLTEFADTPSSALTLDEFMTVDLEEEQDPPSFKAARKKDKERLQKFIEEDSNTLTELQRKIEQQLEMSSKKNQKNRKRKSEVTTENNETQEFIRESTLNTINEIVGENFNENITSASSLSSKKRLEADITNTIGLPSSIEDTSNALKLNNDEFQYDMDLDCIDDDELDSYIMSESECKVKHTLWHNLNANYLQEQKEKAEQLQKEREEGKPEKKRRRTTKKRIGPTNSAGEAIEKIIQEKKISTKINYEVLKSLSAPVQTENIQSQEDQQQEQQQQQQPVIEEKRSHSTKREPTLLKRIKARKAASPLHNNDSSLADNQIEVNKISADEKLLEENVSKPEEVQREAVAAVDEEDEDYDEDDDDDENTHQPINNIMNEDEDGGDVLQMLRKHHADENGGGEDGYDDDYGGYDYDEDY